MDSAFAFSALQGSGKKTRSLELFPMELGPMDPSAKNPKPRYKSS